MDSYSFSPSITKDLGTLYDFDLETIHGFTEDADFVDDATVNHHRLWRTVESASF